MSLVITGFAQHEFRNAEENVFVGMFGSRDVLNPFVNTVQNLVETRQQALISFVVFFIQFINVDLFLRLLVVCVQQTGHFSGVGLLYVLLDFYCG